MKISEAFPSKYLKGADLQGRTIRVKIDRVEVENVGGMTKENKPVVYFIGKEKGMVLNTTNSTEIEAAYGDDDLPCPNWHGRVIEVYFDPSVMFGRERKGGLRVRVPTDANTQQPARQPPPRQAAPREPVMAGNHDEPGSNDKVNDDPYNEDDIPF